MSISVYGTIASGGVRYKFSRTGYSPLCHTINLHSADDRWLAAAHIDYKRRTITVDCASAPNPIGLNFYLLRHNTPQTIREMLKVAAVHN